MRPAIRRRTRPFCALDGRIRPNASWAQPTAPTPLACRCCRATSCGPAPGCWPPPDPFNADRAILVWDSLQTDIVSKDVYATLRCAQIEEFIHEKATAHAQSHPGSAAAVGCALAAQAQEQPNPDGLIIIGPGQRYTETIPVIDIHDLGSQPAALPTDDSVSHSQLNRGGE